MRNKIVKKCICKMSKNRKIKDIKLWKKIIKIIHLKENFYNYNDG